MQHPRPVGPVNNIAAPFSPEMVIGAHPPEVSRGYTPIYKLGWSVSQPTHVQATFTPDMVDGWQPHANRYAKPFPQGTQWWTPEVPVFSIEMVQGSKPDRPRLFLGPRIPLPASQTTHDQTPFGPEMVSGWHPDANRAFVFPKIGWSVSQTTQTDAPFSADMVDGWIPDRQRYMAPAHQGQQWWTPEVEAFSIEMTAGWHPDAARVQLGPRIGQPLSQVTHTAAAFSVEMTAGVAAPTKRAVMPLHPGAQWWTPEVEAFSIEMVQGWRPDTHRMKLAPRIPPPSAQTTHTVAPFSLEMAQGTRPPEQSRGYVAKKLSTVLYALNDTIIAQYVFAPVFTTGIAAVSNVRRIAGRWVAKGLGLARASRRIDGTEL